MRRLSLIATTAVALALASASIANATVVNDPDDPGFAQDVDIETATSSWWGPAGNALITHTIKTYAPYSRRPCLTVRTNSPRRVFTACDGNLINQVAQTSTPISMTHTSDTVTYRFTSSQIDNPRYYRWVAETGGPWGDRAGVVRELLPRLPYAVDDSFPELDDPVDPPDWP